MTTRDKSSSDSALSGVPMIREPQQEKVQEDARMDSQCEGHTSRTASDARAGRRQPPTPDQVSNELDDAREKAERYIEAQLAIMAKYGSAPKLSPARRERLVRDVMKPILEARQRAADALKDWWPCACVKGGSVAKRKPSTHIKLNSPFRKRCSKCGVTREESRQAGQR